MSWVVTVDLAVSGCRVVEAEASGVHRSFITQDEADEAASVSCLALSAAGDLLFVGYADGTSSLSDSHGTHSHGATCPGIAKIFRLRSSSTRGLGKPSAVFRVRDPRR